MEYEVIIGLEVHAELSTKSKIFCSCTTEFGGDVNTHICPICIGMPGTLPVLNKKVVEYAVRAGLATNCSISEYSKMDRKNYFYPDLPKAYQISQYDIPLCYDGYIDIDVNGTEKRIGITRIHIEEDAGKLIHDDKGEASFIDYNRSGVPLIEIVSEPDMRSAEEVKAYLESLKAILEYINVSDCKMQEGSFRADVNLSVRKKGENKLGTRTEMKNLSSFRAVVRAIEGEAARQIEEIEAGRVIVQETRRWDEGKNMSYSMRSKEEARDYRFFPEPDLLPVEVDEKWREEIKNTLPELPRDRKKRYINDFSLPEYDASILTSSKMLADFFEETAIKSNNAKAASNWVMGEVLRVLNEKQMEVQEIPFTAEYLAELITLIDKGVISGTIGKTVFEEMFNSGKNPETIVEEKGLKVINDQEEILNIVSEVLKKNVKSVEDYKNGKRKAFGFLVGQVMKETKGKADPKIVNEILKKELE
ncbi:MAG: Asp-tRNA(Asn)/Glu-tRNA(Gln) amidotransferase subunit GatB [Clostridium sp.]|jgi:aspartyl-tRNA(Asn)/glutamyl-tRNA(Gln) amidotransferase subunit B|nr:Asp-tRNA(Asn)/Glu-tRNA(Gln) amidotransferase subunit GatB [Clostridium sp.]